MSSTFTTLIENINVFKFGHVDFSVTAIADRKNSIDIRGQVHEITIYESLASPVLRCELAVIDSIGLFNNFPLTGEEVVILNYKSVMDNHVSGKSSADRLTRRLIFVIDSITNINVADNNRSQAYIIKLTSIEAYSNLLGKIQQGYDGNLPDIARRIYDEHIVNPLQTVFPTFPAKSFNVENNTTRAQTVVVPNLTPFSAIDMISKIVVPEVDDRYTHVFYQTMTEFNFCTVQGLIDRPNARRFARDNSYKYMSNEITESSSRMNNEQRVVSFVNVRKRHSSLQKLSQGYYNNNRVEINIGQKAIWSERTFVEQTDKISPHLLNTKQYIEGSNLLIEGEEISNRTKYVVSAHREHEEQFPVSNMRSRWGKDLITTIALSQIDLIVTIPGTSRFSVGDLFYLEYPEIHGFTEVKDDDLISGYFLISELKHIISASGYHSVVLSLSKDSYNSSLDGRGSRFG